MSEQLKSKCCGARTKEQRYYETVGKIEQRCYETVCTKCGKSCVPVDKEPVSEAMRKQHEQWLKDQHLEEPEPATPIENPRLLTEDEIKAVMEASFIGDVIMHDIRLINIAQDAKTFDAAHKVPTVEEIAEKLPIVYCGNYPECPNCANDYCLVQIRYATTIHNLMGGIK